MLTTQQSNRHRSRQRQHCCRYALCESPTHPPPTDRQTARSQPTGATATEYRNKSSICHCCLGRAVAANNGVRPSPTIAQLQPQTPAATMPAWMHRRSNFFRWLHCFTARQFNKVEWLRAVLVTRPASRYAKLAASSPAVADRYHASTHGVVTDE